MNLRYWIIAQVEQAPYYKKDRNIEYLVEIFKTIIEVYPPNDRTRITTIRGLLTLYQKEKSEIDKKLFKEIIDVYYYPNLTQTERSIIIRNFPSKFPSYLVPEITNFLISYLESPSDNSLGTLQARHYAIFLLGEIGNEDVKKRLEEIMQIEKNPQTRKWIRETIKEIEMKNKSRRKQNNSHSKM